MAICSVNNVFSIINEGKKQLQKTLKVIFVFVHFYLFMFPLSFSHPPNSPKKAVFSCPVCCQSEERPETWKKIPPPTRPKPPEEFISGKTWRPSTKICALLQELHRMWKEDPEEKAIVFSQWFVFLFCLMFLFLFLFFAPYFLYISGLQCSIMFKKLWKVKTFDTLAWMEA